MVSSPNVAFNEGGSSASISKESGSANFNLNSFDLTAAWNDGLSVLVQGFNGSSIVDQTNLNPSATAATLYSPNFDNLTSVTFTSSGGTHHSSYPGGVGIQFAMDNLTISPVPEPASIGLIGICGGLLTLRRFRERPAR